MFFRDEYAFLSNMYPCEIQYKGMTFSCTEAAYQSQKTSVRSEQEKFQDYTGPQAKRMGRQLEKDKSFDDRKISIMTELIDIKFDTHPELAEALKNVSKPIVEDNTWGDTFWGKCAGAGENHLGKILSRKRLHLIWEENSDEETLLHGSNKEKDDSLMLGIYQMKIEAEKCFRPIKSLSELNKDDFELVYTTPITKDISAEKEVNATLLSDIFRYFNTDGVMPHSDRSKGFHGRSLSVSDIIVIRKGNDVTGYYVQNVGFYEFLII